MALSNSSQLINKLKVFRPYGVTRDRSEFKSEDIGPWSYQQIELGYNYRMTDIAAALGCSQLKKLDRFVERRTEIAESIQQTASGHLRESSEDRRVCKFLLAFISGVFAACCIQWED